MFCSKCHTFIEDDSMRFCSRCGEELKRNKRKNFSSFTTNINKFNSTFKSTMKSSSSSFKKITTAPVTQEPVVYNDQYDYSKQYSNITNDQPQTHAEQAAYSRQYSGLNKDPRMSHEQQAAYSRQYSGLNKDPRMTHDQQAAYSRQYSNLNKNPNKTHDEQYNYSVQYSYNNTNSTPVMSDADYRNNFIGSNYKNVIKAKFSVPALFFGPAYLIYRKMYVQAIAIQLALVLTAVTIGVSADSLLILVNIFLGVKFTKTYLNFVDKKVKKIKMDNPDKSSTEILNICKTKGGTIDIGKFFGILIILYLVNSITTAIVDIDEKSVEEKQDRIYVVQDYNYYVPGDFETIDTSPSGQTHEYYTTNGTTCEYKIKAIRTSGSQYQEIYNKQRELALTHNISDYTSEYKNNTSWLRQEYKSLTDDEVIQLYVSKDYSTSTVYSLELNVEDNYDLVTCELYADKILSTFERENY